MKQYKELIQKIYTEGSDRDDRTGVGCRSIFGHQLKFDLREGFPLVSLKKTNWRAAFYEMIWFLRGDTNIKYLKDRKINIWDEWSSKDGSIGPGYGASLRKWQYANLQNRVYKSVPIDIDNGKLVDLPDGAASNIFMTRYVRTDSLEWTDNKELMEQDFEPKRIFVDQVKNFIESLQKNPFSRRHIMTTWHPGRIDEMNLPPCHGLVIQGYVDGGPALPFFDLHMYQRSCDTVLGLPFNIAEWAFFMHLVSKLCGFIPRNLIISLGDAHIYSNHMDGVEKMMSREPIEQKVELVIKKDIKSIQDIENLEIDTDIEIKDYQSHPFIKFEVAV